MSATDDAYGYGEYDDGYGYGDGYGGWRGGRGGYGYAHDDYYADAYSFEYAWAAPPVVAGGGVRMAVEVRNVGGREGADVPQLYLRFPNGVDQPPLVLRGFGKTAELPPGANQTVDFELTARDLAVWAGGRWKSVAGEFGVVVGASSRDHRLEASFAV